MLSIIISRISILLNFIKQLIIKISDPLRLGEATEQGIKEGYKDIEGK